MWRLPRMRHFLSRSPVALLGVLSAATAAYDIGPRLARSAERPAAVGAPVQRSRVCRPVSDSLHTPRAARLRAGDYDFTIASTVGKTAGATTHGRLVLRPTSAADRSPRTGQGPRPGENRAANPLYGYLTDADLTRVGASLPDGSRPDEPLPSSVDPIFPGFLSHVQNWGAEGALEQNVLTAGTSINARVELGYAVADGPGVFMMVRALDDSGFAGTWQPGGREAAGGYFCAVRLDP